MNTAKEKIAEILSAYYAADEIENIFARLEIYQELLLKWSQKINLVAPSTLSDIWQRHFLDSAQIFPHIFLCQQKNKSENFSCADLGSGAGFPGLVLSILGIENMYLIESDLKKCQFLQEVARQVKAPVTILNKRIEDVEETFDLITARALAPLSDLLSLGERIAKPQSLFLFLKGESWSKELTDAQKLWHIRVEAIGSATSTTSSALKLQEVARV